MQRGLSPVQNEILHAASFNILEVLVPYILPSNFATLTLTVPRDNTGEVPQGA